jgi:hypothetical protein
MRILRYLALLSIAVAAFAAEKPNDTESFQLQPKVEWKSPIRRSDGTFRFHSVPNSARGIGEMPRGALERYLGRNSCYFIRSYIMHRDDDTEAMHLEKMTTCTPMSRFQMKKTVRVVPAVR